MLSMIEIDHQRRHSVKNRDVTLCPCLPGSPDSPFTPLWPYRQEQQVKLIYKRHLLSNEKCY